MISIWCYYLVSNLLQKNYVQLLFIVKCFQKIGNPMFFGGKQKIFLQGQKNEKFSGPFYRIKPWLDFLHFFLKIYSPRLNSGHLNNFGPSGLFCWVNKSSTTSHRNCTQKDYWLNLIYLSEKLILTKRPKW